MFSASTYSQRRNKLMQQLTSGIILLLGNEESPMNYLDNTYHFRQDSTFLYFFGMDFPSLAGIIDTDSGEEFLFGNDLTIDDVVWMGTQPTLAQRAQKAGITQTLPLDRLTKYLEKAKIQNRPIHFLPPYRPENKIKLFRLLGLQPDTLSQSASEELIKAVVMQRSIKSTEEISELEKACDITAEMHLTAYRMVRPGITEAEVAAAVQEVAVAAGGQISFPIIATINGQTLHNHYHGNTLKSGDLFLIDAGAETNLHYAGDMSSTMPVDPTFTTQQKEIYQVAYRAHQAAIAALKPGIAFKEVHLEAARSIVNDMKSLGFMHGDTQEAVHAGAHAMFFPCGLGHMMGLDVHDMEDLGEVWVGYDGQPKSTQFGLKSLRLARQLQPGFVLTIEPGIYFIPELIDRWKAEKHLTQFFNFQKLETYKDFGGIRNEEDFLITDHGARLLGKRIPKSIEEVENIRKG